MPVPEPGAPPWRRVGSYPHPFQGDEMDLGKLVFQHLSDGESQKFGTLTLTTSRWPLTPALSPLRGEGALRTS
jgi:hypothetical protein